MVQFLCLFLFLASQACTKDAKLLEEISYQRDPNPPAAEANYPTAEFVAGGKLFHGLGEVLVSKGRPYSDAVLQIQGYYDGTIRVDSERCTVSEAIFYTNSQLVTVPLTGVADESCLVDFVVIPRYPNQAGSGERVFEMKGQLLIKVLDEDQAWFGASSKVKKGHFAELKIPTKGEGEARVVFRGCGSAFDDKVDIKDGFVTVSSKDILKEQDFRHCALEGAVIVGEDAKRVSWRIWQYSSDFTELPTPSVKLSDYKLFVDADPTVSAIALGSDYRPGPSAVFPLKFSDQSTVLRLITTKGRTTVCLISEDLVECLR